MKSLYLFFIFFIPLLAQATDQDTLEQVLSAVSNDFNQDGSYDRAILVEDGDKANLYIFTSKFNEFTKSYEMHLALVKKDVVFDGQMAGQVPYLEIGNRGALLIKSQNESMGRERWNQTLTVIPQNNEFMIVGITYKAYDTLTPNSAGSCDLNLMTGKGVRNGKNIIIATKPIRLADWSDNLLPPQCQFFK